MEMAGVLSGVKRVCAPEKFGVVGENLSLVNRRNESPIVTITNLDGIPVFYRVLSNSGNKRLDLNIRLNDLSMVAHGNAEKPMKMTRKQLDYFVAVIRKYLSDPKNRTNTNDYRLKIFEEKLLELYTQVEKDYYPPNMTNGTASLWLSNDSGCVLNTEENTIYRFELRTDKDTGEQLFRTEPVTKVSELKKLKRIFSSEFNGKDRETILRSLNIIKERPPELSAPYFLRAFAYQGCR